MAELSTSSQGELIIVYNQVREIIAMGNEMRLEAEIQKDILDHLQAHPVVAKTYRTHNQGKRGIGGGGRRKTDVTGLPDISGYLKETGRALYIEVKKTGGKLSYDQWEFLTEANWNGGLAFVARSIPDVEFYINNFKDTGLTQFDRIYEYNKYLEVYAKLW